MVTIRATLQQAAAQLEPSPTARRDAELLLMRVLKGDRAWLLTHQQDFVPAEQQAQLENWIKRRQQHEPIQYILGEQEFYGLTLYVTPAVLIPRPETEHLVEAALERLPKQTPLHIADIGTGSGAIAVALAYALPQVRITALDISIEALKIAAANARTHNVAGRIDFRESDLLQAARGEIFDAIVSNPPYVSTKEELERQVRDYEPATALYAGETGLDIYRRLIPEAKATLKLGGWLLMEIGQGQSHALTELLQDWTRVEFVNDLQGIPRVAIARRP